MTELRKDLQFLVDRITQQGVVSRDEHDLLIHLVDNEAALNPDESELLSTIFAMIRDRKVEIEVVVAEPVKSRIRH